MESNGSLTVLIDPYASLWIVIATYVCLWEFISPHGSLWVLMRCLWLHMGSNGSL